MLGRVKQTDTSVPTPIDGWFYYTRTEEGQEYGLLYRKRGSLEAAEEVLIDLNAMVDEYIVLGDYRPSPDHRYLAYTTNEDGGIQYTLAIKDLETGETLPDRLGTTWYTESFEWAADGRSIFYVR